MKNQNLKLIWSVTDAYAGQVNECCHAMLDGHEVGRIETSVFEGSPSINWLEVYEGGRRNGVASAMVRDLQERFPDCEIKWGMTTNDGEALRKSLPHRVVIDEAVLAMQRELTECTESRRKFEEQSAAFDAIESPSAAQVEDRRAWFFENGPKWNDLHDRIWELERELRDGPAAEKRLVLSSTDVQALSLANRAREAAQATSASSLGVKP